MNKKKILSLIMALVMLVGVFSPLTALAAEELTGKVDEKQISTEKPKSTTLNLYKLMGDTFNMGKDGKPHSGGLIDPSKYQELGTNVKGLKGVEFTYYKVDDVNFKKLVEGKDTYITEAKVKELLGNDVTGTKVVTGEKGLATISNLAEGNYWFIETGYTKDKNDTTAPEKISSSIAVPFGITLPLTNQTKVTTTAGKEYEPGTVYLKEVNVYPKNLVTNKVEIDKNFLNGQAGTMTADELKDFLDEAKRDGTVTQTQIDEWKAQTKNYKEKKDEVSTKVGTKVPYEVLTKIPQNNTYKSMSWSDIMTKGLKYNDDLKITVEQEAKGTVQASTVTYNFSKKTPVAGATYKSTDYGFDVTFNENKEGSEQAIMKDIAEKVKKGEVLIRLQYSATVTNETVVDKPETNNITFTPGNPDPGKDLNPADKKIEVTKTWDDGKGGKTAPAGVEVTYYLIVDGKVVETVTKSGTDFNHTFDNLDNNKTYTVKEVVRGYKPAYESTANGKLTVTNKINPEVLVPTTPKVVTGGKKFVKADEKTGERLQGAKFEVYDAKTGGKVLAYLKPEEKNAKQTAVDNAKKALDEMLRIAQ